MLKIHVLLLELYDIERNLWTLMADIVSLNAAPVITEQHVKHLERLLIALMKSLNHYLIL